MLLPVVLTFFLISKPVGIIRDAADKLANEMKLGTTVIVTDYPVVREPTTDSTYFAAA